MKNSILTIVVLSAFTGIGSAQDVKANRVPSSVKQALEKKYPHATHVTWEKEKGNFEANWGGKSGEDTSVQFTPSGKFVEEVDAIAVSKLPASVAEYIKSHYKGAKIKEAGKVTDAAGRHLFEAEIKGKDLLFSEDGKFVKKD